MFFYGYALVFNFDIIRVIFPAFFIMSRHCLLFVAIFIRCVDSFNNRYTIGTRLSSRASWCTCKLTLLLISVDIELSRNCSAEICLISPSKSQVLLSSMGY